MENFLLPLPIDSPTYPVAEARNFKLPPLDSSLLLPEIYDWHLENNPLHSVFVFEDDDGEYKHLTYSDIVPAVHRAGRIIGKLVGVDVDDPSVRLKRPVAIMASTDMVTSFCTLLGMMRAEIPILAFAHRNSPQAVAHLLRETQSAYLLISPEPSVLEVARAACEILASEGQSSLSILPRICTMPEYHDIFSHEPYIPLTPRNYYNKVPAVLIHSSGSTSLPKPIPWSHQFLLQCGVAPLYGSQNYCGEIFALHSISMSYGAGIHLLGWVATSGMIVATFRPRSPAQIPTPPTALEAFASMGADYLMTFPHYIEEWSRSEESRMIMKRAKRVVYVGGFVNKNIGDYLAKEGIEIYPLFGMGEAGVVGDFLPPNQGISWEYFPLTPHSGGTFVEVEDGMYELFIVKLRTKDIRTTNAKLGRHLAYRAGDLFVQHPQNPGYWKVVGRKDDRIIHSNGEKTDPSPLEHVLNSDPRVHSAIVFGHGRTRNGALLELYPESYFDPVDETRLRKFRNSYRSTLQKMNKIAPGHSRIFPEMIITTSSNKPFTYTLKGSLQRNIALTAYAREIDDLYRSTDTYVGISKSTITRKSTQAEVLDLVRSIIHDSLLLVSDDDDIFCHGCNSLKAMRIENQIRSVLLHSDELNIKAKHLPRWFIYNYPTLRQLSLFLFSLVSNSMADNTSKPESPKAILDALLEDLDNLPVLGDTASRRPGKGSVIVTGTTGDLGASVLQELVRSKNVNRIYALNRRAPDASIFERHVEAFTARDLDSSILQSRKVILVEADFLVDGFGIENSMLEQACRIIRIIRTDVTDIIHLAWPVNWNMSIASFQDILLATKNLVKLALTLKSGAIPTFMFSSSMGVFWGLHPNQGPIKEESLSDLKHAKGLGYAESKAVMEIFLDQVSKKTGLKTLTLRIGQITGSIWSASHWFPMIVKSSVTLRCFPEIQGDASWLDVKSVARVVVEMKDVHRDTSVVHLLHPRSRPIADIIQRIATGFSLPVVSYSSWLEKIEKADSSELQALPARKILHFLRRDSTHPYSEALGYPKFEVDKATEMSRTLREMEEIDMYDVDAWVEYWRKSGFIWA
ncbi:hypothetical protein BDQ17DRAFT_1311142 [Cyathus striatus]|nr:hypothetical protein BDQ17DRAFT_1311142 [Cyathus striatus]